MASLLDLTEMITTTIKMHPDLHPFLQEEIEMWVETTGKLHIGCPRHTDRP